jgi:hypothetical protein
VIPFSLSEKQRLLRAKFVSPSNFEYVGRVQGIREGKKSWTEFSFYPQKLLFKVDYMGVIIPLQS